MNEVVVCEEKTKRIQHDIDEVRDELLALNNDIHAVSRAVSALRRDLTSEIICMRRELSTEDRCMRTELTSMIYTLKSDLSSEIRQARK